MEWRRGAQRERDKQSLFRPAEQTAEASCFGSSSRPLSIILIIESSRGWFKTRYWSNLSESRVTIPHSDHSAHEWLPCFNYVLLLSDSSILPPLCLRWSATYFSENRPKSTSNQLIKTVKTLDMTTFLIIFVLFTR